MKLTSLDLRRLADNLDSLAKIHAKVNEFEFDEWIIHIERRAATDQRDEDTYFVVAVEENNL